MPKTKIVLDEKMICDEYLNTKTGIKTMALTPTMYNPFNFAPVKGIVTRYAKKLVNNKYYGAIKVDGLTYWNINELR